MNKFNFTAILQLMEQAKNKETFEKPYYCIGFITAVASSPELVPPMEWTMQLVIASKDPLVSIEDEYDELSLELTEWWNHCVEVFDAGETLELPKKLGITATGRANKALKEFSEGYLHAFDWMVEIWQSVLPETEEDNQEALRTLSILNFILARFIDEKAMKNYDSELSEHLPDTEGCFQSLPMLISGVGMLGQDLSQDYYENFDEDMDQDETIDLDEEIALAEEFDFMEDLDPITNPYRDIGRNDLCPCGSGKKFKKCCLH